MIVRLSELQQVGCSRCTRLTMCRVAAAGFPVWYLHGRADVLATPRFAEALAKRCHAPCVFVAGAHFIPRENVAEVGQPAACL